VGYSGVYSEMPSVTGTGWHHVAVTKAGNQVTFYVDGQASDTISYEPDFSFGYPAAVGARGDNLTGSFHGLIDELSIYSQPLTVDQIEAIAGLGSSGKQSATALPITLVTGPPEVQPGDLHVSASVVRENESLILQGHFSDPGSQTSHQVRIHWGDGTRE